MDVKVFPTKLEMGAAAAKVGAEVIRDRLASSGEANIILATGASQFEMLAALLAEPSIDWGKVNCFHLDEYVGISIEQEISKI